MNNLTLEVLLLIKYKEIKLNVLVSEVSKHPTIRIYKQESLKVRVEEIQEPLVETYSLVKIEDSEKHEVLLVDDEVFTLRDGNNLRVRKDGI